MVRFEDLNLVLIDEVKVKAGAILDVWLGPWHLVIPPFDWVVVPKISIPLGWIWDAILKWLDKEAENYYARKG